VNELERLKAEIASLEEVIGHLREALNKMADWLGESQADEHLLLGWMEGAQGNIPEEYWQAVRQARARLTANQNAFLKEFGDMNEPGQN